MSRLTIILLLTILISQPSFAGKKHIKFNIKLGFIKGGEAELIITDTTFNGKPAINYYMMGKTTGLANTLYGVYDIYESTVDAETHLPLKAVRDVKEGNFIRYNEIMFYHDIDSVNSTRGGWQAAPQNLVDIISVFFYYIHNTPFEEISSGDAAVYPTIQADDITPVTIKYLHTEEVKTDMGNINCYVMAPAANEGRILKKFNQMRFFISKEDKLPVFLELDMKLGAIKANIKSFTVDGVESVMH